MERDGRGWMVDLAGLTWEEPAGLNIRQTERAYLDAERRRVVYVAATRARDLFIVPKAGEVPPRRFVCGDLLAEVPDDLARRSIHVMEPYIDGREPDWARAVGRPADIEPADGARVEREVNEWWTQVSTEAARPRFRPASVSGEAHAAHEDAQVFAGVGPRKPREGRFGDLFGTTVHHAIGILLRHADLTAEEATRRAAERTGLAEHLDDAVADVARALDGLRAEGLLRPLGAGFQLEYPVAGAPKAGELLSGYIDLVGVTDGRIDVVDFKTDTPPEGPVEQTYPAYVAQVRRYGRLLEETGIVGGLSLRCGLLFTADGGIRWLETPQDVSVQ
jgi:ATP-dependent helicase/nuclease subunit A